LASRPGANLLFEMRSLERGRKKVEWERKGNAGVEIPDGLGRESGMSFSSGVAQNDKRDEVAKNRISGGRDPPQDQKSWKTSGEGV